MFDLTKIQNIITNVEAAINPLLEAFAPSVALPVEAAELALGKGMDIVSSLTGAISSWKGNNPETWEQCRQEVKDAYANFEAMLAAKNAAAAAGQ